MRFPRCILFCLRDGGFRGMVPYQDWFWRTPVRASRSASFAHGAISPGIAFG
jgi:hypothetical protein